MRFGINNVDWCICFWNYNNLNAYNSLDILFLCPKLKYLKNIVNNHLIMWLTSY